MYVDGACVRNGQPGSEMGVGIVAYIWPVGLTWEEVDAGYKRGEWEGDWPQECGQALGTGTNNRAEVLAVQCALALVPEIEKTGVVILTDSEYTRTMLLGTSYPKVNADIIVPTRALVRRCAYCYINWVRGHDRSEGNIRADHLACDAATAGRERQGRGQKARLQPRPLARRG